LTPISPPSAPSPLLTAASVPDCFSLATPQQCPAGHVGLTPFTFLHDPPAIALDPTVTEAGLAAASMPARSVLI